MLFNIISCSAKEKLYFGIHFKDFFDSCLLLFFGTHLEYFVKCSFLFCINHFGISLVNLLRISKVGFKLIV